MMPPKKSKAARAKALVEAYDDVKSENSDTEEKNETKLLITDKSPDEEKEGDTVNVFKVEIIDGKRKRNLPASEGKLGEWLTENFEEKEGKKLKFSSMYECYLSMCTSTATTAFEFIGFVKAVKERFPKGLLCKEDSAYGDAIKEQKEKKKQVIGKDEVKTESVQHKLKVIITDTINDLGNFKRGYTFRFLRTTINAQHPALRLDLRPKLLKNALERGMRFGQVELVKGMGQCGFYRLPGDPTKEDPMELEKLKKAAKKESDAKIKAESEKEENGDNKKNEDDEGGTDDVEQDHDKDSETETKDAKKEKSVKKKKSKKKKKASNDQVFHGEPKRIEDTFALAMTFMSEPKEASTGKIKKYIERYYNRDLNIDKFKKVMMSGVDKGLWEQQTGIGPNGTFRLEIDEFDPTDDEDLIGQVINAIMACTEPKIASCVILRRYIQDFHPEFKVAERPYLFKRALERAVNNKKISRISGIGASGSFQLAHPFTPSPTVLQGCDTESDYEETKVKEDGGEVDITQYRDAYVPRPTKYHGRRTAIRDLDKDVVENNGVKVVSTQRAPSNKRSAPRRCSFVEHKKSTNRAAKTPQYAESSEDEEPPIKVKKTQKKSGNQKKKKSKATKAAAKVATPVKTSGIFESDSDENDVPSEDDTKQARGSSKSAKSPKGRGSRETPRKNYAETNSDEEEEEPLTKRQRGKSSGRASRKRDDSSSDEDEEVSKKTASTKTGQRETKSSRKSAGRTNRRDYSSSDEEVDRKKTKAGKKEAKSPRRSLVKSYAEADSDDDDEPEPVTRTARVDSKNSRHEDSGSESNSDSDEGMFKEIDRQNKKSSPRKKDVKSYADSSSDEDMQPVVLLNKKTKSKKKAGKRR